MTTSTRFLSGERPVTIPAGPASLPGTLAWPSHPSGIVLFVHGSGSGRLSPRNAMVAQQLRRAGLATLLFDLLTDAEARDRTNVFDIELLADRLLLATEWIVRQPETAGLAVGYFGASTGAAAALKAAAHSASPIGAVVSRGGRPDLAGEALGRVQAATLLIVGGADEPVIEMNEWALERLSAPVKKLVIVPGATHLFEEPGTLEEVARLAGDWFTQFLVRESAR